MLIDEVRGKIARKWSFDTRVGLDDTVLLASIGRSGSTFLSNVINSDNNYRVLFEPFRHDLVELARCFDYPTYLEPDCADADRIAAARAILSGRVHSPWVDKENACIFPRRRLVKDIRANFFLKWLRDTFPALKIILLFRHPAAVARSWVQMDFGDGRRAREKLLGEESFVAEFSDEVLSGYADAGSTFERLIYFWCFSYYLPLRQADSDDYHLIFYEELVSDPSVAVRSLFEFLGHEYSESGIFSAFERPSSTTKKREFDRKRIKQLVCGWKSEFSREEISRAQDIMDMFGLRHLYSWDTGMPDKSVALQLMND